MHTTETGSARRYRRLSYANVMSTVAFVLAFGGGTAYASHLVVTSSDIVDGEVKTADLAGGAVTSGKIRNGQVGGVDVAAGSIGSSHVADSSLTGADVLTGGLTGSDVADGTITGADLGTNTVTGIDVLEYSLGEVASAATARSVNGETIQRLEFLVPSGTAERTLLTAASGLRIIARCGTDGDLEVYARTAGNARLLSWSVDTEAGTLDNMVSLEDFVVGHNIDLVNSDDGDQSGQTAYMTAGGGVTILNWAADNNTSGGFGTQCAFVGTAATH